MQFSCKHFFSLETAALKNAISVAVACRHGKCRVALIGGVGSEVLTQRHSLLQLGGDRWRRRARQSETWNKQNTLI